LRCWLCLKWSLGTHFGTYSPARSHFISLSLSRAAISFFSPYLQTLNWRGTKTRFLREEELIFFIQTFHLTFDASYFCHVFSFVLCEIFLIKIFNISISSRTISFAAARCSLNEGVIRMVDCYLIFYNICLSRREMTLIILIIKNLFEFENWFFSAF
jgi:hypothetical protein